MLEKEGVPTAVIGTDEFQSLFKLESKSRGLPDLPLVMTAHPLGGLREPEVLAKAEALVLQTLGALVAGGEA